MKRRFSTFLVLLLAANSSLAVYLQPPATVRSLIEQKSGGKASSNGAAASASNGLASSAGLTSASSDLASSRSGLPSLSGGLTSTSSGATMPSSGSSLSSSQSLSTSCCGAALATATASDMQTMTLGDGTVIQVPSHGDSRQTIVSNSGAKVTVQVKEINIGQLPTQFQAINYLNFINALTESDRNHVLAILNGHATTVEILRQLEDWVRSSSANVQQLYNTIVVGGASAVGGGVDGNVGGSGVVNSDSNTLTINGQSYTIPRFLLTQQYLQLLIGLTAVQATLLQETTTYNPADITGLVATLHQLESHYDQATRVELENLIRKLLDAISINAQSGSLPIGGGGVNGNPISIPIEDNAPWHNVDSDSIPVVGGSGQLPIGGGDVVPASGGTPPIIVNPGGNVPTSQPIGGTIPVGGGGVNVPASTNTIVVTVNGVSYNVPELMLEPQYHDTLNSLTPTQANVLQQAAAQQPADIQTLINILRFMMPQADATTSKEINILIKRLLGGNTPVGQTVGGVGQVPSGGISVSNSSANSGYPPIIVNPNSGIAINGGGGNGGVIVIGGQQYHVPAFLLDPRYASIIANLTPQQAQLLQELAAQQPGSIEILITLLQQRAAVADAQTRQFIDILITRLTGVVDGSNGATVIGSPSVIGGGVVGGNSIGCGLGPLYGGILLPFYRLHSRANFASIYTADAQERASLASTRGHDDMGLIGYLGKTATKNCPSVMPLYRMFKPIQQSNFYTDNEQEKSWTSARLNFQYKRVEGYCSTEPGGCGAAVPLHRLFNPVTGDHLYTTDGDEVERLKKNADNGYMYERIICYVWAGATPNAFC